jgi:DNA-binding Lrp family transcriptional regulator
MSEEKTRSKPTKAGPSLSDIEKKIMAAVGGDIPVATRPFLEIAQRIGVEEEVVLETLQRLSREKFMRRFGATIRHQVSGFQSNAMVAWQVDEARIDEVGEIMAAFDGVSHCYRRNPVKTWPYNLYTMIHGRNEDDCYKMAETMSALASVEEYALLFSRQELKKISMTYFP